jgi:hypothetical protein
MKGIKLSLFCIILLICGNTHAQSSACSPANWEDSYFFRLKSQSDSVIVWSRDYRLSYDDFQAPPQFAHPKPDTLAVCGYELWYKFKFSANQMKVRIYAVFMRKRSWMRVKEPRILEHEQGHFDIAEVYALKLQKEMDSCWIKNPAEFMQYFNNRYRQTESDCDAEQSKYDILTEPVISREYYFKWIKEQLDSLYAPTVSGK